MARILKEDQSADDKGIISALNTRSTHHRRLHGGPPDQSYFGIAITPVGGTGLVVLAY